MIRALPPVLLLLAAVACKEAEPEPWIWVDVDVDVVPAFDPQLDGAELQIGLSTEAAVPSDCQATVQAIHGAGIVTELGAVDLVSDGTTLTWDGLADDGLPLDPGEVQLVADVDCGAQVQGFGEGRTYIVRLGPTAIDLGVDDDPDQQILAYHKTGLADRAVRAVPKTLPEWVRRRPEGALADLDLDDGTARPHPEPWERPDVPPWGDRGASAVSSYSVPAAYVAGGAFSVGFTPGQSAVSARTGVALPADGPLLGRDAAPVVRIVSDELAPTDDGAWSPGRPAHFRSTDPLPDTLGRHDLTLTWRFEALQDRQWVPIPGSITTTHPLWILAGPTAVQDGRSDGASGPYSWVGVLHDVQDAIQDLPADDVQGVMTALRLHLHEDPYILYNPSDTAYSTYQGRYIYWDRIWLDMSDWLDRQEGIDLYCHSLACLLSSQANHLGIEAEYITLVNANHPETGERFTTWLARPAGGEDWRQYTFNSHGIVEAEGLVYDAAVQVDGDESPGQTPVTPFTPAGVTFEAYMDVLTDSEMVIVNRGRCDNY